MKHKFFRILAALAVITFAGCSNLLDDLTVREKKIKIAQAVMENPGNIIKITTFDPAWTFPEVTEVLTLYYTTPDGRRIPGTGQEDRCSGDRTDRLAGSGGQDPVCAAGRNGDRGQSASDRRLHYVQKAGRGQ